MSRAGWELGRGTVFIAADYAYFRVNKSGDVFLYIDLRNCSEQPRHVRIQKSVFAPKIRVSREIRGHIKKRPAAQSLHLKVRAFYCHGFHRFHGFLGTNTDDQGMCFLYIDLRNYSQQPRRIRIQKSVFAPKIRVFCGNVFKPA
jgi:hypothetical protein